jgi:hypothetical protein
MAYVAPAARAIVGSPCDRHVDGRRLLAAEERRSAVEKDADAPMRAEKLEPAEDLEPVDTALAPEPVQRLLEAHAHAVRWDVTKVLDDQEQQPAFELDVEDDVGVTRLAAVLRGGAGHMLSLISVFHGDCRLTTWQCSRRRPSDRTRSTSAARGWRSSSPSCASALRRSPRGAARRPSRSTAPVES